MKAWSRKFATVAMCFAAIAVLALALAACGGSSGSSSSGAASSSASSSAASSAASSSGSSSSASSASSSGSAGSGNTTIQTSEKEYKITLDKTTVPAGKVTFDIKNDGTIDHDIEVLQGTKSFGKTALIAPGKTATLSVTLPKGDYDVICTVAGHRQLGMDTKLTVQ